MTRNIQLLIIDPQNSFSKVVDPALQQVEHDGELCVAGGWDALEAIGSLIRRATPTNFFNDIKITMDSHRPNHIAHTLWYKDEDGNHPNPFTLARNDNGHIINYVFNADGTTSDVGELKVSYPGTRDWTLSYLNDLVTSGRYPHCIWPPHCIIGTPGWMMAKPVHDAVWEWETATGQVLTPLTKGSNPFVEHFSAVRAEVTYPGDFSTDLNTDFIGNLMEGDEIVLTGLALGFCLANSIKDIANEFTNGNLGDNDEFIKKCVLLTDCTADVAGFEHYGTDFVKEMSARGMKVTTSKDYL